MTFSYSGTKYGFGNQHWEDRHKYNDGDDDLTGSNLTRKDCRKLGNEMYGVCEDSIKGGAAIMKFLKDGVSHHKGGAVISWTCLLYTSPSPRDRQKSRMPSSA